MLRMRQRGMRMTEEDNRLASQAAAGDRMAFRALIERHYDRVFRVALGVLGDASDAEDVAQDVWAAMPSRLKSWRAEARFTTWLHKVALNAARDARRRLSTRTRTTAELAVVARLNSAAAASEAERRQWLEDALGRLSEDLRETAALVVGEGLSHAAAGALLGVAETTVSWRMMEIRKRLRAEASGEPGAEATASSAGGIAPRRLRQKEQPG